MSSTLSKVEDRKSPVAQSSNAGSGGAVARTWSTLQHSLEGIAAVFWWEITSFYQRPASYVLLLTVSLVAGFSFSWLVTLLSQGKIVVLRQADDPVFQFLGPNIFLIGACTLLVPLLTMDLIADERRRGSWETLLTTAITPFAILLGKFLACWCRLMTAFLPWLYFLVVLRVWNGNIRMLGGVVPWFDTPGVPFDLGPMLGSILGLATLGLTFTAFGLLCSSICRGPVAAALLSFAGMLVISLLSLVPRALVHWQFTLAQIRMAEMFSCWNHLGVFSQGAIVPTVIAGHLSVCVLLLWTTLRVMRWQDAA